jgi:hypothetical protein
MTVATFQPTSYSAQATDGNFAVLSRLGDIFAPHEQAFPNMTVALDPGHVFNASTLTEVGAQSTGTITAPAGNPRIDRVVVDPATGLVSVVSGAEAVSPVPPTIPSGKLPVARVLLLTSSTAITNNMITDERATPSGGAAAGISVTTQTVASYTYVAGNANYLVRRSNAGGTMTDTLPGTSPGVMPAGWTMTIANVDASALLSVAAGSGASLVGAAQGFLVLGPNQQATVVSDGANYNVLQAPTRVRLGANTTIYVSTSGSDSNTGLASASAFATIQQGVNVAAKYFDLNGHQLTIQLADGTYTAGVILATPWVGGQPASVILNGNASTPSNVVISTTSAKAVVAGGTGVGIALRNLRLQTTTSGDCVQATLASQISISNLVFGASAGPHMSAYTNGMVIIQGNYSVVGSATDHLVSVAGGCVRVDATTTVTVTGTPNFTAQFASASAGNMEVYNATFSGAATGKRYTIQVNGTIATSNGGANFFPGNAAGTTATGGQYN